MRHTAVTRLELASQGHYKLPYVTTQSALSSFCTGMAEFGTLVIMRAKLTREPGLLTSDSLFLTAITESPSLAFQLSLAKTATDKAENYLHTFCLSSPSLGFDLEKKSLHNSNKGKWDEGQKRKKIGLSRFCFLH